MLSFKISLEKLRVAHFTVNEVVIDDESHANEIIKNLAIEIKTKIAFDEDNKLTMVILKLAYINNTTLENMMEITLETIFRLEPFNEIRVKTEKGIKFIDDNIAYTILGITFSTARGIIFEKLRGSKLQQFLLPVVDPKILLSNNDLQRQIKEFASNDGS